MVKRLSINNKISSMDQATNDFYKNADTVMRIARNAPKLFQSSETEDERRLVSLVLQNLELHESELRWKYKKPFDSVALYKSSSSWQGHVESNHDLGFWRPSY